MTSRSFRYKKSHPAAVIPKLFLQFSSCACKVGNLIFWTCLVLLKYSVRVLVYAYLNINYFIMSSFRRRIRDCCNVRTRPRTFSPRKTTLVIWLFCIYIFILLYTYVKSDNVYSIYSTIDGIYLFFIFGFIMLITHNRRWQGFFCPNEINPLHF